MLGLCCFCLDFFLNLAMLQNFSISKTFFCFFEKSRQKQQSPNMFSKILLFFTTFFETHRKMLGLCCFCLDFSKKHRKNLGHRQKNIFLEQVDQITSSKLVIKENCAASLILKSCNRTMFDGVLRTSDKNYREEIISELVRQIIARLQWWSFAGQSQQGVQLSTVRP